MHQLQFSLIHPFTPSTCGVSEQRVTALYTSLFMALANLHKDGRWACDITFLTDGRDCYQTLDDHGLPWMFYPLSFRSSPSSHAFGRQWSWALWRQLLLHPPGVVCFFIASGTFAKFLAVTCMLRRVSYFIIVGGWGVPQGRSQRFYFENAKSVIVHTRRHIDYLETRGYSRQNMVVMPIGVDTRRFTPKPGIRYEADATAPRLLLVSRIVPGKGVMEAIESFARIRQVLPSATLQIVGPASAPQYFRELKDRISELGLQTAIQIEGQLVPNDQLARIYQEADLFIFPTKSESLGIVMLESMACGTPVVTLKGSGSTDEVVRNGEDGLVVEPCELASATISLLKDRDAMKRMGLNAAERVRTNYSDQVTSNTLRSLLDQAIGGSYRQVKA